MEFKDLLDELNDLPGGSSPKRHSGPTQSRHRSSSYTPQAHASSLPKISCSFQGTPAHHSRSPSLQQQQQQQQPSQHRKGVETNLSDLHSSIDDLLDNLDLDEPAHSPTDSYRRTSGTAASTSSMAPSRPSASGTSPQTPNPSAWEYFWEVPSSSEANGSAIGQLMCCDALRCTKCDLGVIMFPNKAWNTECDYLFFRNNYPTEEKLAAGQRKEQGTCAYSCQCSWKSVQGADAVRVDSYAGDLNWVCKGHALL